MARSAASACSINIPAIAGYVSGTVTIPLISYVTPSPVISGLAITPPPGLYFLTANDDGFGTINVTFSDRLPQTATCPPCILSISVGSQDAPELRQ